MNVSKKTGCWGTGTLLVFLFVWQQLQSVRVGYELEHAHRLIAAQRGRNGYLRLEIERRLSPAELARAARERLKMNPPNPDAVIVLDPEAPALGTPNSLRATSGTLGWRQLLVRMTRHLAGLCAKHRGEGETPCPWREYAPGTARKVVLLARGPRRWLLAARPAAAQP